MVRLSLHSYKGRTLKPSSATIDVLPQEILLLHELETLVEFVPPETSGAALNVIMPKVRELHVSSRVESYACATSLKRVPSKSIIISRQTLLQNSPILSCSS